MKESQFFQNNLEVITLLLALLISAVSVFLAYRTIRIQQRHNKLSVRPIAGIFLSTVGGIKIELVNLGIGPLICKQLITKNTKEETRPHLYDFMRPLPQEITGSITFAREGFAILPGNSSVLFHMDENLGSPFYNESLEQVIEDLSDLTLIVHYKSMYNELQPVYVKELSWFKDPH